MGILDVPGYSQAAADGRFARPTKPTIVLFGDSRTDDCDLTTADIGDAAVNSALNAYCTNMSWFDWGQASLASGPVFDVISNSGIGGNTTTQMLARIQADVIAYAPSYMTIWGGTNDGWATVADVDATFARMVAMIQAARAANIYVFVISETTSSTKGATFPNLVQYYNEKLRGYAASNSGMEFWDFNSVFINPTGPTGYPLTSMTRDGVHLSAFGAMTLGQKVVAPKLARFTTALAMLPNSVIDTTGNNGNVRNAVSNPFMTGSAGVNGGGDSGTLPNSWSATGTPTAAHSVAARPDGFGNDLTAVITAASANGKFYTQTLNPARILPGIPYVIEASIGIALATNLFGLSLIAQLNSAANSYSRGFGLNEQAPAAGDTLAALSGGIIRSRKFMVPAGTVLTSATLVLTARFAGAGGATIKLGRVALKRVD